MKDITAGKHDTELLSIYKQVVAGVRFNDGSNQTKNRVNNPFKNWWDGLTKIFDFLTTASNWKRIGLGALGAVLLILVAVKAFKS
jgi:hypothetical protein